MIGLQHWHAAEERHRGQLRAFGLDLPRLIPYGCKAMVRTKTWHRRWATVMGPAEGMASSAGAYWVMTVDGHGFRSTIAVRPRRTATIEGGVQAIGTVALGVVYRKEVVLNVMVKMQNCYIKRTRTPLLTNSRKRRSFGRC